MPTELGPGSGTGPLLKNIYLAPGHYWYYGPPKAQYLINKLLLHKCKCRPSFAFTLQFFLNALITAKREERRQ